MTVGLFIIWCVKISIYDVNVSGAYCIIRLLQVYYYSLLKLYNNTVIIITILRGAKIWRTAVGELVDVNNRDCEMKSSTSIPGSLSQFLHGNS